jgi:hypothetical protein
MRLTTYRDQGLVVFMKRKICGISIGVFISLFVITCSNQTNPFLNKSDSKAKIVSRNVSNSDTVEIFSTQKFVVYVYLREHMDSIRVHIDNNRLQTASETVIRQSDITSELSFPYSFYKTGKQNILLVSYINSGDSVADSCFLYAVSPLRQNNISGKVGDSLFLSTPPVVDQVMYVWDFHNGINAKESRNSAGIKLTTDFTNRFGELFVEDLSNHRSPSYIFQINSTADTQSQLSISCPHDSILEDSVYSRTADFKFTVVVSGAKHLTSASVNGVPFDDSLKIGESFVLSHYLFNLDTVHSPVELKISVADDSGHTANKTWYVHYVKIDPAISVAFPAEDNTTTAFSYINVFGTVMNNQQYNKLFLFILKNGKVADSATIIPGKAGFSFRVPLSGYSNHITLELYADSLMIGSRFDASDFYVFYNPTYIDNIPPQIKSIRCNNETVIDSTISRTDTVKLDIEAMDNSGWLAVYVNGDEVGKDSNTLVFSTNVIIPRTKISTLIQIKASDSSGYSVCDSVYVKYNRLPQWIKTPAYTVVTAGEDCEFEVQVSDPDQDSLFVTMIIERINGTTLLDATSGHVTWHPQLADSGEYKVSLNAGDRTESIDTSFTLLVKGKGAVPVKLLKSSIVFPDTVTVGEPLHVVLCTAPLTGTKPYIYSARFIDERPKTIQNSTDSIVDWTPSAADTGLRILRVAVSDGLNFKDSMDVYFRVMKKILACIRWKQNTSQYHEGELPGTTASIIMNKPLNFKVSIPYTITFPGGTNAASAEDIKPPLSGIFTFNGAGDTVASIILSIVDDQIPEYTERFEIRITGNDSIKVCDSCNTVFVGEIIDNDLVTFSFVETEAEGYEGKKDLVATVKLSKALQTDLELYYEVDWAGTGADTITDFRLDTAGYKLTFAPGVTQAQIKMDIIDDSVPEENEKITLRLHSETEFALPKDSAKFVYTIMNDDTPVQYSFIASEMLWLEQDTQMTVLVRLDRKVDSVVVVKYALDNDLSKTTATAGADFQIAENSDSLVFNPGETSKTLKIDLVDDTLPELTDEFFTLKLQSVSSLVKPGQFTLCKYFILKNEVGAFFASQSQSGDEEYNRHPYCKIMLTKATDIPVTVTFSSDNSTAEYGSDYTMTAPDHNYIIFNPGEFEKDVGISIDDDERRENTEYIRLQITGVSDWKKAYIMEEKKSTVITITNN